MLTTVVFFTYNAARKTKAPRTKLISRLEATIVSFSIGLITYNSVIRNKPKGFRAVLAFSACFDPSRYLLSIIKGFLAARHEDFAGERYFIRCSGATAVSKKEFYNGK